MVVPIFTAVKYPLAAFPPPSNTVAKIKNERRKINKRMRAGPVSQSGVEYYGRRILPAHYKCFGGKNFV